MEKNKSSSPYELGFYLSKYKLLGLIFLYIIFSGLVLLEVNLGVFSEIVRSMWWFLLGCLFMTKAPIWEKINPPVQPIVPPVIPTAPPKKKKR